MKSYSDYTSKYSSIILLLSDERKKNENFARFVTRVEREPDMGRETLDSLMITPIQRIPRYILLLQQLIKYTNESHPDYQNLNLAMQKMQNIAKFLNEKNREVDDLNYIVNLQKHFVEPIIKPGRKYVKELAVKLNRLGQTEK